MAFLSLVVAVILWGSSPTFIKLGMEGVDGVLLMQLRLAGAALLWLPLLLRSRRSLPRGAAAALLGSAFLSVAGPLWLTCIGLRYIAASTASILFGVGPLAAVLLGRFFWRERAKPRDFLFCASIFAGVALVVGWPRDFHFWGCLLVLLAQVSFVCSVHWSKRIMRETSSAAYTAWLMAFGALLFLPFTLGTVRDWHFAHPLRDGLVIAYLAAGPGALAYWLWNRGVRALPGSLAGLFLGLEQVTGILLAAALLGERLGPRTLLGGALVILPILAGAFYQWRQPAVVPE